MDKKFLVVLSVLLVICIAIIAFLLGRESSRQRADQSQTSVSAVQRETSQGVGTYDVTVTNTPGTAPVYMPPEVFSNPSSSSQPLITAPQSKPAYQQSPYSKPQAGVESVPEVDSAEKSQVAEYFRTIDSIATSDPASGDPRGYGQKIINSALSGDYTEFDKLVEEARTARMKFSSVTPPKPCREFHSENLALMDQTIEMFLQLKQYIKTQDSEAITALSARAAVLQQRGNALIDMEKQMKARYGIYH